MFWATFIENNISMMHEDKPTYLKDRYMDTNVHKLLKGMHTRKHEIVCMTQILRLKLAHINPTLKRYASVGLFNNNILEKRPS